MLNSNEEFVLTNGEKFQHKQQVLVYGLICLCLLEILFLNIGLTRLHLLQNKYHNQQMDDYFIERM